jgi:excinuclease ABC subunit B
MPDFKITSDFDMMGDQPRAVEALVNGLNGGLRFQTLMGVTGSGKTFNMANVIESVQRPTLVMTPNKTLAAQLATELKGFFPENAVEYFVSYYDYYQPEAYIPRTDTYIEKETSINQEIDKLRHSATRSLLTRRDVIIVASVSCIYGLGSPEDYYSFVAEVRKGEIRDRQRFVRQLVEMQYERTNMDLSRAYFRVRGDVVELVPAYDDIAIRVEFWGDQVERIVELDYVTGEILAECDSVDIYPARHFVTPRDKLKRGVKRIQQELKAQLDIFEKQGKLLEAQRIEQRTNYDLEMLLAVGYCSGVENYSGPLGGRDLGSAPWTLLDYFPDDFLVILDESHQTIPQLRAMFKGDRSRKTTLVDYGWRLPSALDNRPLNFEEFCDKVQQGIFVSATPAEFELRESAAVVQQIIRPTGLLDPVVEIHPIEGQVDDLVQRIRESIDSDGRCLVTTLTKKMAEELADYFQEVGINTHYLHSEIHTLERSEILRDLRLGVYDVVVGINLLREGLDLPEVNLVAILDADKEGYLRSAGSLIQTMGRAARHESGKVVMYADTITRSMHSAIDETLRRRTIQAQHNVDNGIVPTGIKKEIRGITDRIVAESENSVDLGSYIERDRLSATDGTRLIADLQKQMKQAAKGMEFERAAMLRDEIVELRNIINMVTEEEFVDKKSVSD